MILTSLDFKHNDFIPRKFTCQGLNINPRLAIGGCSMDVKSLALIINDIDASTGEWVHWLVYDIPVISNIGENSVPGTEGIDSFGRTGYGGPCPPSGTHRYVFKMYALARELKLTGNIDKEALEKAMDGHIIDSVELVGLYKKS